MSSECVAVSAAIMIIHPTVPSRRQFGEDKMIKDCQIHLYENHALHSVPWNISDGYYSQAPAIKGSLHNQLKNCSI
jgi:hypothetical protein